MRIRAPRQALFPVNVWPPMVDAVTMVLAAFVLIMIVGVVVQRGLISRLHQREAEVEKLRTERERLAKRIEALAATGVIEVDEGKVILQGEVLFDSGSDELRPDGQDVLAKLAGPLGQLLASEPDQMVLIGGHTDDVPIHNDRFGSNWELSTARAVAVEKVLTGTGLDPARVVAAGFGPYHPRAANRDDDARRKNRRIEVLLVPIHSVASR